MNSFEPERISEPNEQALNEAIDEMLEGTERSDQWRVYIEALQKRREMVQLEFDATNEPEERAKLEEKLNEIDDQIKILAEEKGITEFIENSVKYSYEVRRLSEG